ncbi:hypothetical protein K7711_36490 [Nocardia sp. CA2R105]|uniref:hypothetical protein n=1 Tax=Nocardia coffeae TaxID=2873381 RepID=UPI001CA6A0BA|nr:hypothetical protein [Nocardia coffeae]MBY8862023.1 hypothetical protein [Nocardia coffeae]
MSWPQHRAGITDPDYYRDIADLTERDLRAGFAHHHLLRTIAPHCETNEQAAQFTEWADALDGQWGNHDDSHWRTMWVDLLVTTELWNTQPDRARVIAGQLVQARATGELAADSLLWRNWHQAREITGHGHDMTTGSAPDGHRPQPGLQLESAVTTDTTVQPTPGDVTAPDRRSAVDRTLGAPRDATGLISVHEVDQVIAMTDDVLLAEEYATRAGQRAMLLPPEHRDDAVHDPGPHQARWTAVQQLLTRQVQDLAAAHTHTAEGFTGDPASDSERIEDLERLQAALRSARADALGTGASPESVTNAYLRGTHGMYGRDDRGDRSDAPSATPARLHDLRAPDRTATEIVDAESDPSGGTGIAEAVDAALVDGQDVRWSPTTASVTGPEPVTRAGADPEQS